MKIEPSNQTQRLRAALQELEERIKAQRNRDRADAELAAFMARWPLLQLKDVIAVANRIEAHAGGQAGAVEGAPPNATEAESPPRAGSARRSARAARPRSSRPSSSPTRSAARRP